MAKAKFWNFKNESNIAGELTIYGTISDDSWWGDEVTPKQFAEDLKALGNISVLNVRINSGGGDVFAGQAIYAILKAHSATVNVYIDGIAASIASIIAMAGDKIIMHPGSMMMIHNPWSSVYGGNSETMRKTADTLDKIRDSLVAVYKIRTNKSEDELMSLMDEETWMTAEMAVEMGFADEITGEQAAASLNGDHLIMNGVNFDLKAFKNKEKLLDNIKGGIGVMNFEQIMNTLSEEQRKVVQNSIQAQLTAAVKDATDKNATTIQNLTTEVANLKAKPAPTTPATEDELLAAADPAIAAMVKAARDRAQAAETEAQTLKDEKELTTYKDELTKFNRLPVNAEKLAPTFRSFAKANPEGYKELQALLIAANNAIEDGHLFEEAGSGAAGSAAGAGNALDQLNAKATTIAEAQKISKEKAFLQACKESPKLYAQYLEEISKEEE